MSGCVPPWVYLVRYSLRFLDLSVSSLMLGKFLAIISSNIFSGLSLSLLLLDPYNVNVGVFYVVPEVSETVLISFHSIEIEVLSPYQSSHLILKHLNVFLINGKSFCPERL